MTAPRITPDHPAVIRDSQGKPLPPIPDPNGGELLVCWLDQLPAEVMYRHRPNLPDGSGTWTTSGQTDDHFAVFVKLVRPTIEVDEADLLDVLDGDVDSGAERRLRAALEAQGER